MTLANRSENGKGITPCIKYSRKREGRREAGEESEGSSESGRTFSCPKGPLTPPARKRHRFDYANLNPGLITEIGHLKKSSLNVKETHLWHFCHMSKQIIIDGKN